MTTVWMVLGIGAVVLAGVCGWVAWRDRVRVPGAEERAAGQAALTDQQWYERQRYAAQHHTVIRNDRSQ
ncbi:hypothetical protein [Micromonospora sp. KC721]|uniref:hypothetical protein n=1 Tax=Micromonospora sp. KC721 TaxID=2530380 RepID=UPI001046DB3A|nr:hypothetical protein [Micromonospora sp. KC721]TDB79894.1 hypothetical protein E1182_10945 [Micromonospora sp. KC721]